MAKLYFYYSAMNAGKSTTLIQTSHNYCEKGMNVIVFTYGHLHNNGKVTSRIGLSIDAIKFYEKTNIFEIICNQKKSIDCVLIDECHFLNRMQVQEIIKIVDKLSIPVLCYGLRTDFQANPFDGSLWLLSWADKLVEIKTICFCGKKANRVLRMDKSGLPVFDGNQIVIGGNEMYTSVCRKHFIQAYNKSLKKIKD